MTRANLFRGPNNRPPIHALRRSIYDIIALFRNDGKEKAWTGDFLAQDSCLHINKVKKNYD